VHPQPARRRLLGRRRRREDQPAVLHQGRADPADPVLRTLRRQGRQEEPFTIDRFRDFFDLLPTRADGDRSWTLDLAARRYAARSRSAPLRAQAEEKSAEAQTLRERVTEWRKSAAPDRDEIAALEAGAAALLKDANELQSKAEAIENAVYGLKAVNPNAKAAEEGRTPEELLDLIDAKSQEVAEALASLRAALKQTPGSE